MTSSAFFNPASRPRLDNEPDWITDRSGQKRGEIPWPPMGRSGGHQWGLSMAAVGEIPMAAVTPPRSCRCPPAPGGLHHG